ncbi:RNA polymerase factor sigma-54 [Nocardioides jiangxiensis]|uniref:RNA polymerase sigma-54 factor n=1 Tax=Nocardioides jiangxiensis TaxID=3064524 RepID=A0ABT9B0I0_9ACTN|nr:hypothetical protein [Nocardioides sp. WY-20]MDO7866776.1 hypothetical protein [Nocardioides sp. WY-20]
MDRSPQLELRTTTQLRASLLTFLSLLHVGAADLESRITAAVAANPVLERRPGGFCPRCGQYAVGGRCAACRVLTSTAISEERAAAADWRADLAAAARLEAPAGLAGAIELVVASLDDRGLLSGPVALAPPTLRTVVEILRQVGPPGVAASSAVDCVLVQVAALSAAGRLPGYAPELLTGHLEALAAGRIVEVAAALGVTPAEVAGVLDRVRSTTTPYVPVDAPAAAVPTDVVFRLTPAGARRITAVVVDTDGYGLGVVRDLGDGRAEAAAWLRPHLREAQHLLDALNARATMLQRVADVLAAEQGAWIETGRAHRALRRADVARTLGVHPSTVGRAVADKTARLPDGRTVPLTRFFGAGPAHLERVAEALRAHPGATDAQIAAELAAAGEPLARRTVAKYRALLGSVPKPASPAD